jgi:hypothetical protein
LSVAFGQHRLQTLDLLFQQQDFFRQRLFDRITTRVDSNSTFTLQEALLGKEQIRSDVIHFLFQ